MKKMISCLVFVFGALWVASQNPLSLAEAIEIGLQNNYGIDIAEEQYEISKNNNTWGQAGRYPDVNLILTAANSYSDISNPAGIPRERKILTNGLSPALEFSWVLFNGRRIRNTKNQLAVTEIQSKRAIQTNMETSIQAIMNAYYLSLIQQEQYKIRQEVLALSRDRVAYQEVRKEFGQAVSFDLLQAKDAYLTDSTNLINQAISLKDALQNLNLSLGAGNLESTFSLTDSLAKPITGLSYETLERDLLADNTVLDNLRLSQAVASLNADLARGAKLPTISMNGNISYNASIANGSQFIFEESNINGARSNILSSGLNLVVAYPLLDGGNRKRTIENAAIQESISDLNYQNQVMQFRSELKTLFQNYQDLIRQLSLNQALVDNSQQNLAITRERFKGGLINSFEVRSVEISYLNAALARLNTLYNLKLVEVNLLRLTGKLVQ